MKKKLPSGRILGIIITLIIFGTLFGSLYIADADIVTFKGDSEFAGTVTFNSEEDIIDFFQNLENPEEHGVTFSEDGGILWIDEETFLNSIVDTESDFVESNSTIIEQFIDEVELAEVIAEALGIPVTEKFLLETSVTKFTSSGIQLQESSSFIIPERASLVDKDGNLLDLGSVQIGFFGAVKEDNEINYKGRVSFWLDDRKLTERAIQGAGFTKNKILKADIFDGLKATGNKKPTFTFTFADEPLDVGSHTFRVIIHELTAQAIGEEGDVKIFEWKNKNFIAYQLDMEVDDRKIVIFDGDLEKAISVFKSDSTITLTGHGLQAKGQALRQTYSFSVDILDADGKLIKKVDSKPSKCSTWKNWAGLLQISCWLQASSSGAVVPRNSEVTFRMYSPDFDEKFTVVTPKSQHNYAVSCGKSSCSSNFEWFR